LRTFAQRIYFNSPVGALSELPGAGTPIENPFVYDASAREIEEMAAKGLVRIVVERRHADDPDGLIRGLTFERLR
jgi:hypothetical protein